MSGVKKVAKERRKKSYTSVDAKVTTHNSEKYEYSIPQNCFFGRKRLKKHSEKTEIARPRREQRRRKKAGERASGGPRKSTALSRRIFK